MSSMTLIVENFNGTWYLLLGIHLILYSTNEINRIELRGGIRYYSGHV